MGMNSTAELLQSSNRPMILTFERRNFSQQEETQRLQLEQQRMEQEKYQLQNPSNNSSKSNKDGGFGRPQHLKKGMFGVLGQHNKNKEKLISKADIDFMKRENKDFEEKLAKEDIIQSTREMVMVNKDVCISVLQPGNIGINLDYNRKTNEIRFTDAVRLGQSYQACQVASMRAGSIYNALLKKINDVELITLTFDEAVEMLKIKKR